MPSRHAPGGQNVHRRSVFVQRGNDEPGSEHVLVAVKNLDLDLLGFAVLDLAVRGQHKLRARHRYLAFRFLFLGHLLLLSRPPARKGLTVQSANSKQEAYLFVGPILLMARTM